MGKKIYKLYKQRLVEIGGTSKCLCLRRITAKNSFDIGKQLEGRPKEIGRFLDFLFKNGAEESFPLILPAKKSFLDGIAEKLTASRTAAEDDPPKKLSKAEAESIAATEVRQLRTLVRETEDVEKETGRSELFVGYPFVFGCIQQGSSKTLIKAPLLLFPVRIDFPDESSAEIRLDRTKKFYINPSLIFAYAQSKKISLHDFEPEYNDFSDFSGVGDVLDYLGKIGIRIAPSTAKNLFNFSNIKDPDKKLELGIRNAAVLGRFPLSNSIYNDYCILEKQGLANQALNELLRMKRPSGFPTAIFKKFMPKRVPKPTVTYPVKHLDSSQAQVLKRVDESGNTVIYGPPGTGKSQVIVNIITDAMCKHKRILVVSQKKAALDVVYNRLGLLNEKAIYVTDETAERKEFYSRVLAAHKKTETELMLDVADLEAKYNEVGEKIAKEKATLDAIRDVLMKKRPFGLSLAEMYAASYNIPKNTTEYSIYSRMIRNRSLMALNYKQICDALFVIKARDLEKLYYNFMQDKEKNPIIDRLRDGVDFQTLAIVKGEVENIQKSRKGLFNASRFPYFRQVLAYYYELKDERNFETAVKAEARIAANTKGKKRPTLDDIRNSYEETIQAIDDYAEEYTCLHRVLTEDGYLAVLDNILRGNNGYLRYVHEALENYIALRDVNRLLESLGPEELTVLNFAYSESKNYANYVEIIDKLLCIRIYHEVCRYEDSDKEELAKMLDFQNVTARIRALTLQQLEISNRLCAGKTTKEYEELFATAPDNKEYLHQISKEQNFWPIRRTMELYSEYLLRLFPCWLLSPENVSSLLPLTKNMFDLVIFDEASQVFIENTIPTIYRGKNIVIAGDSKQLRPSATFMKRFLGTDGEEEEDLAMQAALEVESLLDLAVSRYQSAHLTYHYRSRSRELIEFSNCAFYGSNLQIAPNVSKNRKNPPIERCKVPGKWIDRKNTAEAEKIVSLLKDIFRTRKHNESVGIITFNSDQQGCIADAIDRETLRDSKFRSDILNERHRVENGEDTGLFIKNLENVQGDERDIIIFSIGYAENEMGKIYANFGSLSTEGGENRLNVAITRAKSRIIVVTSIEPEELHVESAKNLGPKLLQKYLIYVRAVSQCHQEEALAVLNDLSAQEVRPTVPTGMEAVEDQMKEMLEKAGYKADVRLGNANNRIALAVYDEKSDRYLVGVELDRDAYAASDSAMERDVSKPEFLESRGWTVMRVWCRDWWLYPQKVIRNIISVAEENRK